MVRSRFGVERCCCPTEQPDCECQCVCAEPFAIYDPLSVPAEYRGVWESHDADVPDDEFSIVMWSQECNEQTEVGVLWHQYQWENGPTTVRVLTDVVDGNEDFIQQFFAIEIRDEAPPHLVKIPLFGVQSPMYPGTVEGCKMRVVRYRQVRDENNFLVPEVGSAVFIPSQPVKYSGVIQEILADEDIGFIPQGDQRTFVGAEFPKNHPRYNPNLDVFNACLSHLQIYDRWLTDSDMDFLWNLGEGRLTDFAPGIYEHWCADEEDPWETAYGSIRGTPLWHNAAETDERAEHVLDEAGRIVHGIGGVP